MIATLNIADSIREKITRAFAPAHLEIENESHSHAGPGAETHFRLVVASAAFEGVSRIERQRRVQDLFHDERARGLHALTMRVFTIAEWDAAKASFTMKSPACGGGNGQ